ncbi:MAG: c-type cytochrome [Azospirillum sp.]|nr:c-type cytochrome [Azospirillum sp.]
MQLPRAVLPVALVVLIAGCAETAAPPHPGISAGPTLTTVGSPNRAAIGENIAESRCVTCHQISPRIVSENRMPGPPFPDIAVRPTINAKALDQILRTRHIVFVTGSAQTMPAFNLTDDERTAMVDYILSFRSQDLRAGAPPAGGDRLRWLAVEPPAPGSRFETPP